MSALDFVLIILVPFGLAIVFVAWKILTIGGETGDLYSDYKALYDEEKGNED